MKSKYLRVAVDRQGTNVVHIRLRGQMGEDKEQLVCFMRKL